MKKQKLMVLIQMIKRKEKNQKIKKGETNLYNAISLINKEVLYYQRLISSLNEIDIMIGIPIFMIFKYFYFLIFLMKEKCQMK